MKNLKKRLVCGLLTAGLLVNGIYTSSVLAADESGDAVGVEESTETQESTDQSQTTATSHTLVTGSISLDGSADDWANVTGYSTSYSQVDSWKVAYSEDGNGLYFMYTGTAVNQWDYNYFGYSYRYDITYSTTDGSTASKTIYGVYNWSGTECTVKTDGYADVSGAEGVVGNTANSGNAGPYVVELYVPVSAIGSDDFTISFGSSTISSADIQQINGTAVSQEETTATYNGIVIDGSYSDWDAIEKTDVTCPNDQHPNCISQAAAVWDGDYLYIYIKDGDGSGAYGAGTHSNGKFAIKSDYNYELDIQLKQDGTVVGADGISVEYVGSQWEISIPTSELPNYEEYLSFGFYEGTTIIDSIYNLQGTTKKSEFSGITLDGDYDDWDDYSHTTIQYATSGSQESQVDAKGALYLSDDGNLYGHVVTSMPAHLQEAGGEFTYAVTINYNSENPSSEAWTSGAYTFSPRFITVDSEGNINWSPQTSGLSEGTYEFYIVSASELPYGSGNNNSAWGTSTNINNLSSQDTIYGKMIMTIGTDGCDEMEFVIYQDKLAEAFGCDDNSLQLANAQFGRIGQQWISVAGTSTGPIVGIILMVASVGLIWFKRRREGLKVA